jgi:hypothetical protein
MTVVYDAGWQGKKVRALIWLLLACGVLLLWLAFMEPTAPLPPELDTAAERFFGPVLSVVAGVAMAGGILLYGRCYVGRVEVEDDGTVRLRTIGPLGSPEHVLLPGDIGPSEFYNGLGPSRGNSWERPWVDDSPWLKVRVRGRRLPLILDLLGEVLDADRAARAVGLVPGQLALWEVPRTPPEPRRKPVFTEKERKRFRRARRRR